MAAGFNVLTDAWIPLDDGAGKATYASYVELLGGEKDAAELVHPRDDVAFFARMLLSALTQALFPVANATELRARIDTPMKRQEVAHKVDGVMREFELTGDTRWMQLDPAIEGKETPARRLLLDVDKHLLFRPRIAPGGLCPPCATILLYGFLAFAPSGGSGYVQGVRGSPCTTTLISIPSSVRASAWANTLHHEWIERIGYPADAERAWAAGHCDKSGQSIGLVEGLFWKPRAIRFTDLDRRDACTACGQRGQILRMTGFDRSPRQAETEGIYRHPMTPLVREQRKGGARERFASLDGDRPAWTALADWLGIVRGDRTVLAAPVVDQWLEQLRRSGERTSILVLDYAADKMSITHRFVQSFSLSSVIADRDVAEGVASRVEEADKALGLLRHACVRIHMKTRPGHDPARGPRKKRANIERDLLHDVSGDFWQRTEPAFWKVYDAMVAGDLDAQATAEGKFTESVREIALELFDGFSGPSLGDPSRIAVVAEARRALARHLFVADAGASPSTPLGDHAA